MRSGSVITARWGGPKGEAGASVALWLLWSTVLSISGQLEPRVNRLNLPSPIQPRMELVNCQKFHTHISSPKGMLWPLTCISR
jgi:hypothetical protein